MSTRVDDINPVTKKLSKLIRNKNVIYKRNTKKDKERKIVDDENYKINDTSWNDDNARELVQDALDAENEDGEKE
jgi:hypothetical protein